MQIMSNKGGITTAFIKTTKFKSELLTIRFILPLKSETAGDNSLAASIIFETSDNYRQAGMLSRALSKLYGAGVNVSVDRVGDNQIITFSLKSLADKYALGEEKCFTKGAEILYEILFNPYLVDGAFEKGNFSKMKRILLDKIDSEINDKRIYAKNQLLRTMFKGLPYETSRLGSKERVEAATEKTAYEGYKRILNEAEIYISFSGENYPEELIEKFLSAFPKGERKVSREIINPENLTTPNVVTEEMDITQGKLVMGFLAPKGQDRETYPYMIMSDIFGGGPYSKLFENVREKMGLCYYCSARMTRIKGFLMVESGVEKENAIKAKDAILEQLEDIKCGKFSQEVIESSKKSICDSLNSLKDSNIVMDNWFGVRSGEENPVTPEEMESLIKSVTKEQIIECAKSLVPHTFYFLLPQGEK